MESKCEKAEALELGLLTYLAEEYIFFFEIFSEKLYLVPKDSL